MKTIKSTYKKLTAAGLCGLALLSIGTIFGVKVGSHSAQSSIELNGNHYTERQDIQGGCKEYWIDCATHQIFLEEPTSGNWTEAGEATEIVMPGDDRYLVPSVEKLQEQIATGDITVEEAKKQAEQNCGVVLDDTLTEVVDVIPGTQNIIIPEGVTDIDEHSNPFNGNNEIKSVAIPTTFDSFSWHDIINCNHLKEITIRAKEIKYDSIVTCSNLQIVNIGKEVEIVCYGAFVNVVPTNSKIIINCEVPERPSGWDMNWNIKPNYSSYFTVNWNASF